LSAIQHLGFEDHLGSSTVVFIWDIRLAWCSASAAGVAPRTTLL